MKNTNTAPCSLCLKRLVGWSCLVVARRVKSEARRAKPEAGGENQIMKIEIRLLTQLKPYLPNPDIAGDTQIIDLKNDATVKDVMMELGIPLDLPKVIMLNEKQGKLDDQLKDGDRVTIFPPVGGG